MAIDPELEAIRAAMDSQGRTRADVARQLGLESSLVTRLFQGKRRLQRHEAASLRGWLGLGPAPPAEAEVLPGPGMVPLYGWAGAASEGRHVLAEQVLLGVVARHPAQANLREAFALRVADVSMSPRYEPGEVIYLAPNQWPAREQDCVLVTRQGFGYLKRFIQRSPGLVRLRQLNPAEDLEFKAEDVAAMHAVVGRG